MFEDFTSATLVLSEFERLALSVNPDKKIDTDVNDIMEVLDESENLIDVEDTKRRFWDMFIVDAIIGNTDRHNGNWGFLIDTNNNFKITFSPIYDCGSCLNPLLSDEEIEKMDLSKIKNLAINTYSCLKENGKKINYLDFITSKKNKDCNEALNRVFDKINIDEIEAFIHNVEGMSDVRKNFYINIIKIRYNTIREGI